MNALANLQREELKKFLDANHGGHAGDFCTLHRPGDAVRPPTYGKGGRRVEIGRQGAVQTVSKGA